MLRPILAFDSRLGVAQLAAISFPCNSSVMLSGFAAITRMKYYPVLLATNRLDVELQINPRKCDGPMRSGIALSSMIL